LPVGIQVKEPFGTTISIEDNVGVIHVAQTGTKRAEVMAGGGEDGIDGVAVAPLSGLSQSPHA
jgi:hypothetical protein